MTDTVFRTSQSKTEGLESLPEGRNQTLGNVDDSIEVPFKDYQNSNSHPFTVDYFKIGDTWSDPQGGFPKEIELIEGYITQKIDSGEIANSQTAVKELMKTIEKTTNMSKEERAVVKVETIAAYIEFLNKTDGIKSNLRRYAYT